MIAQMPTPPIPSVVPRYVGRLGCTERSIQGISQTLGPGWRLPRYVGEACPGAGGALTRECSGPSCPLPGRIGRVRRAGCRYNPPPAQPWSLASARSPASPVGNKRMAKAERQRKPPAHWPKAQSIPQSHNTCIRARTHPLVARYVLRTGCQSRLVARYVLRARLVVARYVLRPRRVSRNRLRD